MLEEDAPYLEGYFTEPFGDALSSWRIGFKTLGAGRGYEGHIPFPWVYREATLAERGELSPTNPGDPGGDQTRTLFYDPDAGWGDYTALNIRVSGGILYIEIKFDIYKSEWDSTSNRWVALPKNTVRPIFTRRESDGYQGDFIFDPEWLPNEPFTEIEKNHIKRYLGYTFRVVNSEQIDYNEYMTLSYSRGNPYDYPFTPFP